MLSRLGDGQDFRVAILSEGLEFSDRNKLIQLADELGRKAPPAFVAGLLNELYDRSADRVPAPEIVWTGPRIEGSCRYTPTIVAARRIVDGALRRILIAGYRVTVTTLETLGVWSAVDRGVAIDAIVNSHDILELDHQIMVSKGLRVHRAAPASNDFAKFHVKALVSDGQSALVGSANFTSLGQTSNVEMGLWVTGSVAAMIEEMLDSYLQAARCTGWLISP